jgi:hypothetical protein
MEATWSNVPCCKSWVYAHNASGAIAWNERIFTSVISCPIPYSRLAMRLLNKLAGMAFNLSGKNSMRLEINLIYCWQRLGICFEFGEGYPLELIVLERSCGPETNL